MSTITVGSQFTTLKSGVTGTVQEIIKNPNGSTRMRLETLEGVRWTTVKQFDIIKHTTKQWLGDMRPVVNSTSTRFPIILGKI